MPLPPPPPPSSSSSSSSSHGSLSTSSSSALPASSKVKSTTASHPLDTSLMEKGELEKEEVEEEVEERLPHLEMGVADVLVVRSRSRKDSSSTGRRGEEEKRSSGSTVHSRGSSYAETLLI